MTRRGKDPMAGREKSVQDRAREADRYRVAAELTLDQLQWVINYLYRIQKPTLAAGLDENRKQILAELDAIAHER
jgi:hypothetical protein